MLGAADLIIIARVALAGLLGFIVGWEREAHGHAAGVRTLALIAMGGAVFTALAQQDFPTPDRIIANIVTGVGFLGAGMILHANVSQVRGLTTAASIWTMTSISVAIGLGHYLLGVALTGLVLLLLWWQYVPWLSRLVPKPTQQRIAQRTRAIRAEPSKTPPQLDE